MKIILASKSGVRKKILDKNRIENEVIVSNVDEDEIKASLLDNGMSTPRLNLKAPLDSISGLYIIGAILEALPTSRP